MNSLINYLYIPNSSPSIVIIRPANKTFITGLSLSYSLDYPIELVPFIDKPTFINLINEINDLIAAYWPCLPAEIFGYLFCPCSLGLSFMLPNNCIKDGELVVKYHIAKVNECILMEKGLRLSLRKKCGTSWLEIDLLEALRSRIKNNKEQKNNNRLKQPLMNFEQEEMKWIQDRMGKESI